MTASLAPPAGAVEGGGRTGHAAVGVGVGGRDRAHRGRAAVLLVVGVQDEQHVERPRQRRIGVVAGLGHLPEHRQEGGEGQRVVRVDEGHPDAEPMTGGSERRHLGDQPDDLLQAVLGVVDVLGVEIEGRECRDRRDQHPHGMGVVVEALEEPLAHVDERAVRCRGPSGRTPPGSAARRGSAGRRPPGTWSSRPAARWGSRGSAGSRRRRRSR